MVENTGGFNNNPEDRNNNPDNSKMVFVNYEITNPNKQKNQPENKEKNIDTHRENKEKNIDTHSL